MKTTLIDTLYIVALLNEKDENHEKANELVEFYNKELLVVTDAVLLEIGNSLSRRYKTESVKMFDELFISPEVEIVRLDETLFNKAFELYSNYSDKTWGLVDCVSFVVMRERGITDALTSDQHFVQAGFNALMLDSIH